jgi:hypothetical protein
MYDLSLWLLPRTASFSRAHRYTLGTRIEDTALDVIELLVEASYTTEKRTLLSTANRRIERLRYLIRLAHDLKLLSVSQYEFAGLGLQSVGNELGGWLRSLS